MPKVDDGSTGIKSISNSQKTKAAKAAKAAKLGIVKKHGGCCSACGQDSTSCTPGTSHLGCKGFFQGDFGYVALNRLAELTQRAFTADGSIVERRQDGTWIDRETIRSRRNERDLEAQRILRAQTHIIPIEGGVKFENGMGEPVVWHDGKYVLASSLPTVEAAPIVETEVFTEQEVEALAAA